MIKPTIGRIVWYWAIHGQDQPYAAIVTYVHSDELVNLAFFYESGVCTTSAKVTLYQGEGLKPKFPFCEWMPYQIGQAKKYEEVMASNVLNEGTQEETPVA